MFKKAVLMVTLLAVANVFAANQSSGPVKKKKSYNYNKSELNKPTVGSRQQSSDQLYGTPKITGHKGEVYTPSKTGPNNSATVGSRQQSSDQQFGAPALSGSKGVRPDTAKTNGGSSQYQNNPNVGGRQSSSDQIFGNPGNPANQ